MDRQLRVTDLVPKRPAVLAALFLAGIAVVAGLEALYAWMPDIAAMTHDGRIAAFDLDSEGSLAVWFSSSTLALAGLVAILIYSIRRHRVDDYYGRYRIWLSAAACWMLMSIDEAGSLHEGFKEMMSYLTGRRLLGDGSLWWVMPYLCVLGYVGIRLLLEMRESRSSIAALLATAGCYATAVLTQLEFVMPESGARGVMLEEGAEMFGNLFLLLSMALFARHVILDAEGLLPVRKVRKKAATDTSASSATPPAERRRWFGRSRKGSAAAGSASTTKMETAAAKGPDKAGSQSGRHSTATSKSGQSAAECEFDEEIESPESHERRSRRSKKGHRELRFDEAEDSPPKAKLSKAQRKAQRRRKQRERGAGLA